MPLIGPSIEPGEIFWETLFKVGNFTGLTKLIPNS